MTWFYRNPSTGVETEHNFVAPSGSAALTRNVLFPLSEVQSPAYAATLSIAIAQMNTFLAPAELTGNVTINLTVDSQVTAGAKLFIKLDTDSSIRTVTLGTGFDASAADIVIPASSVIYVAYVFNGTSFAPISSAEIDLAALTARTVVLEGSEVLSPVYGATLAVTLAKKETFLQPGTLTGAVTINLTIGAGVPAGAKLHLKVTCDGTGRTVTLGTGFAGLASIAGKASSTSLMSFVYDGTSYLPCCSLPA